MQCVDCKEINEYADANQANGSYICYKCRPIKFAGKVAVNSKLIKINVGKKAHTFFYHNFEKRIDSFDLSFKFVNDISCAQFDAIVIATVLDNYPSNYNAKAKPFRIFGLSNNINLNEYAMEYNKSGITYAEIKRVFWSCDDTQKSIDAAKQLCEKDIVLNKTLSLDEYKALPEFIDGKFNYNRY